MAETALSLARELNRTLRERGLTVAVAEGAPVAGSASGWRATPVRRPPGNACR